MRCTTELPLETPADAEALAERRPLLLWDGDCGLCRRCVTRWRHLTEDRVTYVPYQLVLGRFAEIGEAALARAVHLIEADGTVTCGAEAVFRALAHAPGPKGCLLWLYRYLPGFGLLARAVYAFVARHRARLAFLCRGPR